MVFFDDILGLHAEKLNSLQMGARSFCIFSLLFFYAYCRHTPIGKTIGFDTLTALMLGAVMGRAIVAKQSFFGPGFASPVCCVDNIQKQKNQKDPERPASFSDKKRKTG